jgi:hypothetical protein
MLSYLFIIAISLGITLIMFPDRIRCFLRLNAVLSVGILGILYQLVKTHRILAS